MKLFVIDLGWEGGLVGIAETKEAALEFWKDTYHGPYLTKNQIENIQELPLENGTHFTFMGDS